MNETATTLRLRWEAAERFCRKMQEAYEAGRVDFAEMDAADVAACNAYDAWQAAQTYQVAQAA